MHDDDRSSHDELMVREAAARYESVDASRVNNWLRDLLPSHGLLPYLM